MKAIKRIIDTSDSEIISNGERYTKRSRAKDMSIRGKTLLKMRNTSHVIAVRSLINRVLEPKLKLELLRL